MMDWKRCMGCVGARSQGWEVVPPTGWAGDRQLLCLYALHFHYAKQKFSIEHLIVTKLTDSCCPLVSTLWVPLQCFCLCHLGCASVSYTEEGRLRLSQRRCSLLNLFYSIFLEHMKQCSLILALEDAEGGVFQCD